MLRAMSDKDSTEEQAEDGHAKVIDLAEVRAAREARFNDTCAPITPDQIPIPGPIGDALREAVRRGMVSNREDGSMRIQLDGETVKELAPKLVTTALSALMEAITPPEEDEPQGGDEADTEAPEDEA